MAGTGEKTNVKGIKGVLAKLAEAMKKNKKLELIVYGALILLGLLLFLSTLKRDNVKADAAAAEDVASVSQSEMETEQRLEQALSNIRGAGSVKVMIMYDTGTQLIPAMNVDTQESATQTAGEGGQTLSTSKTESQKPLTASQNGLDTVVLTEKQPEIRGVIVIAEGAANISVRLDLQSAVQTVLGVKAECVNVYEMKTADKENQHE